MRNLYYIAAVAASTLSLPSVVSGQLTQNWVVGYSASSPTNAHIATDGSGNIYIAANTSVTGYTLLKYNSAGTGQWATTSAAGTSLTGVGVIGVVGVKTDNAGNVYVVSNGSSGIVVAAYNPSAAQLWSTVVNTGGGTASARVMTADGAGNVYIGGQITASPTIHAWAYMTIRVSGGVQKYLSTFEGSGNQFSSVTGIACDATGNAYVTGTAVGIHTFITHLGRFPLIRRDTTFDMTTIKYDSAGNAAWTNVYHAAYGGTDFGFGVAVDPSGNVYALGQSSMSTGLLGDLVQYSSGGVQQWVYQNSTSPNNESIAIDPSGNIFTSGVSNFNISKFTPTGALSWSYSNSSISLLGNYLGGYLSMALDKGGNCYITSPLSNSTDYFTAEITSAGGLGWTSTVSTGGQGGSSGIAIYTPVSRFGMITYPQINVTGVSGNNTNFTTVQYSYHLINHLNEESGAQTGLDNSLATIPAERLFNYPNPFRGSTTISYTLTHDSRVTLQVYDQNGKLVTSLFEGDQGAGTYSVPFTAARLVSGIYHYRLLAVSPFGNFIQTKSLSILR
jgi:hypothetical protein